MSSETSAWAKEQRCGDPVTKAVLMEIANWAKPNGLCEYLSVKRIANVVEVSPRTVQRHIDRLEDPDRTSSGLGMIRRVERHGENGSRLANAFELVGYQPPFSALASPHDRLSPPRAKSSPARDAPDTVPGDTDDTPPVTIVSPDKSLDRIPPSPANAGDTPAEDLIDGLEGDQAAADRDDAKPEPKASRLPEDWKAPPPADLPPMAQDLVKTWPVGAFEASCETFRLHWLGETRRNGRKKNWPGELGKWLINDHPKVTRAAKAGVSFAAAAPGKRVVLRRAPPLSAKAREDGQSGKLHCRLRKDLGDVLYGQWLAPAALCFDGSGLVGVFPSEFTRRWAEDELLPRIEKAAAAVAGHPMQRIKFEVESAPARLQECG